MSQNSTFSCTITPLHRLILSNQLFDIFQVLILIIIASERTELDEIYAKNQFLPRTLKKNYALQIFFEVMKHCKGIDGNLKKIMICETIFIYLLNVYIKCQKKKINNGIFKIILFILLFF